jgi:hypothetical protein
MEKMTKLYEVKVSDFGETAGACEELSNVIVIGYDKDRTMTFMNFLDPESLDESEQLEVKEICTEIIESLSILTKHEPCTLGDTEHRSPYEATVAGMLSPDYKERFKAEYQQTKIRYEKLKAFCNRIEAAERTICIRPNAKSVEMPKHDCLDDLLRAQQRVMGEYLHILEVRAVIEGIEL